MKYWWLGKNQLTLMFWDCDQSRLVLCVSCVIAVY